MMRFVFIRRIVGKSMAPRLKPGKLVFATPLLRKRLKPGQVVILEHHGKEKIKRIERIDSEKGQLFVIGDNLDASSDSRHFGWITKNAVRGRVFWPRDVHN
ncbi:MAG TPA: S26 family signal peptidase [Candidatus Saccharimonadales bacterium]